MPVQVFRLARARLHCAVPMFAYLICNRRAINVFMMMMLIMMTSHSLRNT